jgi:hypothetical protein
MAARSETMEAKRGGGRIRPMEPPYVRENTERERDRQSDRRRPPVAHPKRNAATIGKDDRKSRFWTVRP